MTTQKPAKQSKTASSRRRKPQRAVTLEHIARKIDNLEQKISGNGENIRRNTDKIDDVYNVVTLNSADIGLLSRMSNKGFDGLENRISDIKDRLTTIERNQDDMRQKVPNMAYRFELKELEKTVRRLEKKAKIKHK